MKTVIYLVRHGESVGNKKRLCLGHTDLGLTELGRMQAEKTASVLSDLRLDKIYSSDLCRAMQTAEPHAVRRSLEITPKKELRELYFGEWENMSLVDINEKYTEKYTVEWKDDFGTYRAPGGESIPELALRMRACIYEIARENLGETLLIASHAAAIRSFWGEISGIKADDLAKALPFPSNASYSVCEYDSETDRITPVSYSNDAHLADVFTTWRD